MYRIIFLSILITTLLFSDTKTALLTAIARDAIVSQLTNQNLVDKKELIKYNPYLAKKGATFVTLNEDNSLRGCIGSLKAYRPLIDDLVSNAQSAAFSDSRFMALNRKELSRLKVEVSLLTEPEEIDYNSISDLKSKVIVGENGIVLETFLHKATFLPQVWDDIPNFDQFFQFLCEKAGLDGDCLTDHPSIYRYRVDKYSENDLTRRPTSNAGSFYPKTCTNVEHRFASFRNRAQREKVALPSHIPRAMIVPHAGYIFSGYTADQAYRTALKSKAKRVILIGPSHHLYFKGIAVAEVEAFDTPCGILRNDEAYLKQLQKKFTFRQDQTVFSSEHSTEVQLPFINHYLPQMKVVEFVYGDVTLQELSNLMQHLLHDPDNLLVISSDLSHYYNQKEAQQHDFICLDGVEMLHESRLNDGCEACGKRGIEAIVKASKTVHLKSELVDYRTSADASGNEKKVVGYMSAIFY